MHRMINVKRDYGSQRVGVELHPLTGSMAQPNDPSPGRPLRIQRWLAPKLDYLPVQMQQTEPGKVTITLVLTEIHFDKSPM